jgi:hypothetical protein
MSSFSAFMPVTTLDYETDRPLIPLPLGRRYFDPGSSRNSLSGNYRMCSFAHLNP